MTDTLVIPRPVHDEAATVWVMARQMLSDIDRDRPETTLPTGQLILLLETLSIALERPAPVRAQQPMRSMLSDAEVAPPNMPNYWRRNAELDE